jgi:hypothetical protein
MTDVDKSLVIQRRIEKLRIGDRVEFADLGYPAFTERYSEMVYRSGPISNDFNKPYKRIRGTKTAISRTVQFILEHYQE